VNYIHHPGLMTYSVDEIQKATGNFASKYLIGKGGFGEVYRAQLRCSDVAVKILRKVSYHCVPYASIENGENKFMNSYLICCRLLC